jgi:threonine/homoserine/homoserine lactone efflux protein
MNLLDFVATVVVVTASGALAPGPLTFGILMHGSKGGARSGFSCAIGHMLVELPLVLALAFGLLEAANQPFIKEVIGLVGGVGLIGFGLLQIYETLRKKTNPNELPKKNALPTSSLALGLALTGLNPYFILWWLTIGSVLVIQALAFAAILGVLLMYVSHVWMDYAFLTALGHVAKEGKTFLGSRYYKLALIAFGVAMLYYGFVFISGAIS